MPKLIGAYQNGNYFARIYDDGTKIRETDDDAFHPLFPESIDLNITKKCSQGCAFCYAGCCADGEHADLLSPSFLDNLHPYTELAINGNDLDHPQLREFLERMKEKQVIVNMTVNQNQFLDNYALVFKLKQARLLHGIGVSFHHFSERLYCNIYAMPNTVLHVIAGCVKPSVFEQFDGIPILILGYKKVGRGAQYYDEHQKEIDTAIWKLDAYLDDKVRNNTLSSTVAFDNLAVSQLHMKRHFTDEEWDKLYMGNDGSFTFYVDMVSRTFATSSTVSEEEHIPLMNTAEEMLNAVQK